MRGAAFGGQLVMLCAVAAGMSPDRWAELREHGDESTRRRMSDAELRALRLALEWLADREREDT